jgi:hypothetical protein
VSCANDLDHVHVVGRQLDVGWKADASHDVLKKVQQHAITNGLRVWGAAGPRTGLQMNVSLRGVVSKPHGKQLDLYRGGEDQHVLDVLREH